MSIITLTTDLGLKDHYVASIKGAILSQISDISIVDITHNIEAFNISQTAYVIRNCYKNFPKGSIHILGVDAELSIENSHLAVFYDGHYFIGPDNGVLTPALNAPSKVYELNQPHFFLKTISSLLCQNYCFKKLLISTNVF